MRSESDRENRLKCRVLCKLYYSLFNAIYHGRVYSVDKFIYYFRERREIWRGSFLPVIIDCFHNQAYTIPTLPSFFRFNLYPVLHPGHQPRITDSLASLHKTHTHTHILSYLKIHKSLLKLCTRAKPTTGKMLFQIIEYYIRLTVLQGRRG